MFRWASSFMWEQYIIFIFLSTPPYHWVRGWKYTNYRNCHSVSYSANWNRYYLQLPFSKYKSDESEEDVCKRKEGILKLQRLHKCKGNKIDIPVQPEHFSCLSSSFFFPAIFVSLADRGKSQSVMLYSRKSTTNEEERRATMASHQAFICSGGRSPGARGNKITTNERMYAAVLKGIRCGLKGR